MVKYTAYAVHFSSRGGTCFSHGANGAVITVPFAYPKEIAAICLRLIWQPISSLATLGNKMRVLQRKKDISFTRNMRYSVSAIQKPEKNIKNSKKDLHLPADNAKISNCTILIFIPVRDFIGGGG